MRRRVGMILAAAMVGLAAVGCGDDEETLTEEEFVQQANEICAAGNDQLDEAASELQRSGRPARRDLEQFVRDDVVPTIQQQVDEIGALAPPPELEEDVNSLLEDAQAALDRLEQEPTAIAQPPDPFAEVNEQAEALGLDQCAG